MHYLLNNTGKLTLLLLLFLITACREQSKSDGNGKKSPDRNNGGSTKINIEQSIEMNRNYLRMDQQRISQYLAETGTEMKETGTGLWYKILKEGEGENCTAEDAVSIECRINDLLSGELYFDSARDGLKTFVVGHGNVVSGLEEGILMLNRDSRALFIIPPSLAFGLSGDGDKIPPRAILLYEVHVVAVN